MTQDRFGSLSKCVYVYVMCLGLGEFVDWGFRVVEESVRSQTGLEFDNNGKRQEYYFLKLTSCQKILDSDGVQE